MELRMHRGAFYYVAFVFLFLLVLLVSITLLDPTAAAAQNSVDQGPELIQGGGRELGLRDWINHIPLALGALLIVVAVDAFVIFKFVRRQRRQE